MDTVNQALWSDSPRGTFRLGPAPYPTPGPAEVVVRVQAVAVNPVDTMTGLQRRLVYPWLSYPTVLGTDVAGEVVEVGPGAGLIGVGDRVAGLAIGQEHHCNNPSHGAFQRFVVLPASLTTRLPADVTYTDAAVLPLALATASAGLFGREQLALQMPARPNTEQPAVAGDDRTLVVWGGSTSVGLNAIQLARHAGLRVVATASPHNHGLLLDVGADQAFDYRDPEVVRLVLAAMGNGPVAGILAIGAGSLRRAVRIATSARTLRTPHPVRVASAHPTPSTAAVGRLAALRGVRVSAIWGGTVARDGIGAAVFTQVLPTALAAGTYHPAPPAEVVGAGLDAVPDALGLLRAGVSARKLVVTLGD